MRFLRTKRVFVDGRKYPMAINPAHIILAVPVSERPNLSVVSVVGPEDITIDMEFDKLAEWLSL